MLFADAVPVLKLVTAIMNTPLRWTGYARDRGAMGVLTMLLEVNEFLAQAKALAFDAFTDLITWGNENPGKRTVIILVVLIIAAATIYITAPLIAAELGMGALAAETVETTTATGLRVVVREAVSDAAAPAVRRAMQQQIMQEALIDEAGGSLVQREVARQAASAVVRASAVPRGTAALNAARQVLVAQAGSPLAKQAVEEFLKRGAANLMVAPLGIPIGAAGRIAYEADKNAPPDAVPKGQAIGLQVGQMFLLRADKNQIPAPAGLPFSAPRPTPPQMGREFDAARLAMRQPQH